MNTPLIFKLDIYTLTQHVLDQEYVTLTKIPFPDSLFLSISEFTTILQNRFSIIKITKNNIADYSEAKIDGYVVSWKNSDPDVKNIFLNNKDQRMSIQYINHDEQEIDISEVNKEDHVDWEP